MTKLKPELSKKNKYWISKHRYYELKHFCLQYPEWRAMYLSFGYSIPKCLNSINCVINPLPIIEGVSMKLKGGNQNEEN